MNDHYDRFLDREGLVPIFPYQRGEALTKLNKIVYHEKALQQLFMMERSINRSKRNLELYEDAVTLSPKQRAEYNNEKRNCDRLVKQKERIEEKILLMEANIKKDIETDK